MGLLCLMRWVLTNGLNLGDALGSDVGSKESSKKASTDLCTGSGLAQQDLNCTRAAEERGQAVIPSADQCGGKGQAVIHRLAFAFILSPCPRLTTGISPPA